MKVSALVLAAALSVVSFGALADDHGHAAGAHAEGTMKEDAKAAGHKMAKAGKKAAKKAGEKMDAAAGEMKDAAAAVKEEAKKAN